MTGRGRRWGDWVDTDGNDVSRLDRARAVVLAAWPFLACAAAVAVILAATIVSIRAIRERDALAAVTRSSAASAREAKRAADSAEEEAQHIAALLQAQADRDAARQPLIDAAISRIIDDNAEAHAALLGEIARLLNRPVPTVVRRPTVTAPPAPPAPPRPTSAPAPPPEAVPTTVAPTTTVPCDALGRSGRCRR